MMKKIIVFGCILLSLFGCKHIFNDPAKPVGKAALHYYQQLLNGDYAAFVDATYRPDSLPSTYRSQLILNAKMFIEQQQNEHDGLKSVAVAHATIDEAQHTGNAFLTFRTARQSKLLCRWWSTMARGICADCDEHFFVLRIICGTSANDAHFCMLLAELPQATRSFV